MGKCTHDTLNVDTVMFPETLIFDSDKCIDQIFRNIIIVDIFAICIEACKNFEFLAVLIVQGCLISFRDQILCIYLRCIIQNTL